MPNATKLINLKSLNEGAAFTNWGQTKWLTLDKIMAPESVENGKTGGFLNFTGFIVIITVSLSLGFKEYDIPHLIT